MKTMTLTAALLASLSFVSISTAARAAFVPAVGLGNVTHDDQSNWITTVIQENEGTPNPDRNDRCVLTTGPVTGLQGHFVGHQRYTVCE